MISRFSISWSWKLQLKSLYLYSTASAAAPPNVMADFLINSLGFSKQEAIAATQKLPSSKSFKNDPNAVIDFFEKLGLSKPQIKSIVSTYPRVLLPDLQKSLQPKIKALQDIGLSGSDLITVLTTYKSLLCRPLETNIISPINYLTSFLGSKELVCKALLSCCSLLHNSTVKRLAPNIIFLKKLGFSEKNLSKMMIRSPRSLLREPKFLEEIVEKVENKYKVTLNSKMFFHVLIVVCTNNSAAVDKKFNIFKSFGWSEENIQAMFRTSPYIVGFSEDRLRKQLQFYSTEIGYKPDYLATHPVLLNFSLEKRVKPRIKIMKILREKNLIDEKCRLYLVLCVSNLDFIKRFILPYMDDVTLSKTDLGILKDYIFLHKDKTPDLYKLHGRSKIRND